MEAKTNKPGAGKSILGFLLTLILIGALMISGISLGLKMTILKGNNVEALLENLDVYGSVTEILSIEAVTGEENEEVTALITQFVSEELMEEVGETVMSALRTGTEVDLTGAKDICMGNIKGALEETMDRIIEVVESTEGEITAESLAANEEFQIIEEQFGFDVSEMIMSIAEENGVSEGITAEDMNLEEMKEELLTVVEEEVMPEVESLVDEIVVEVNNSINEELDVMIESTTESTGYNVSEIFGLIDKALLSATIETVISILVTAGIVVLELLLYKKYVYRGVRNVGIASIFAGLLTVLIGGAFSIMNTVLSEMTGATEPIEVMAIDFVGQHISNLGGKLLIFGGIYVVAAIVCFVAAGKLKRKFKAAMQDVQQEQNEIIQE